MEKFNNFKKIYLEIFKVCLLHGQCFWTVLPFQLPIHFQWTNLNFKCYRYISYENQFLSLLYYIVVREDHIQHLTISLSFYQMTNYSRTCFLVNICELYDIQNHTLKKIFVLNLFFETNLGFPTFMISPVSYMTPKSILS